MVIFQLEDLEGARLRAQELGVRVVWQIDLPDISGTHLHPADMRGAIVSLDQPRPPGSWRWGGPEWTGRVGSGAPGQVVGVTIEVGDPDATAERWGQVLGVPVSADGERPELLLDRGRVVFAPARTQPEPGLTEIEVALSGGQPLSGGQSLSGGRPDGQPQPIGGVRFVCVSEEPAPAGSVTPPPGPQPLGPR
jgi:hypothetical protein